MERTKFKLIKGEYVGLNQPVYETQYRNSYYTNCYSCKRKVGTDVMYIDNDGSQRHFKCLSPQRRKEIE